MRGARAALALAVLLAATAAGAKKRSDSAYVDKRSGFRLNIPSGWQAMTTVEGDSPGAPLLTVTNDKTDQLLMVTKIKGPTDGAWNDDPQFFELIESGIEAQSEGFERLSAKKLRVGKKKVPAYELWFRVDRQGKPYTIGARFLFFKGYALSLVVDTPGKRADGAAKKIVGSFAPAD